MAMQYDVKSAYVPIEGDVYDGRCRIKGVYVAPDGGGDDVVLTDGNVNILLALKTTDSKVPFYVQVPGEGILAPDKLHVDPGGCVVTVFYG